MPNIVDKAAEAALDRELVARIKQGDLSACAECVALHSDGIYRLAYRLMGNESDAEDVVQETFLSAFKAIERFDGRSSLGTWLFRIAYNAAMMRLRRKQPRFLSVDQPLKTSEGDEIPRQLMDWCCLPEVEFASDEARTEIGEAVSALPERLKAVFVLRELEGHSTVETAEILEISPEAVKTRLHRARLWLRERLSDYFSERVKARNGA
jgi:RNA polymerase sigma-70 factor (ECF subfamily)